MVNIEKTIILLVIMVVALIMLALTIRWYYHRRIRNDKNEFLDYFYSRLQDSENYLNMYAEDINDPELEATLRGLLTDERNTLEEYHKSRKTNNKNNNKINKDKNKNNKNKSKK